MAAEDSLLISVVASSQSLATAPQSTVSQAGSEADCAAPCTLYASVITSSYSGPPPSEVVDACARTAFSGKLVSNLVYPLLKLSLTLTVY